MPIYEFECEECGERFEELVAASVGSAPCPACGSERTRRLISTVSPPGQAAAGRRRCARTNRGGGEREAARQDRISESRKRRAAGEKP